MNPPLKRRRMSVSRTAFTRIHRDALPTVKREERTKESEKNAHALTMHCFAPRYGSRPTPATHFSSHIGRRPVAGERARLVARSLAAASAARRGGIGRTHGKGEGERGGRLAAALLTPFFLPYTRFPLFALHLPVCLHSLPSQLYMRGETHYMSFQKS